MFIAEILKIFNINIQPFKKTQVIQRKTILLAVVTLVFCLLLCFYPFENEGNSSRSTHRQNQRNGMRSRLITNNDQPIIFSKFEYLKQKRKASENVICFLVASFEGDIRLAYDPYPKLREKIGQLDERLNDNFSTDIIIFHTGYPFRGHAIAIIENTRRQVEFVNIDHIFYQFSPRFDPHMKDPLWTQKGKWNYQHMSYFWFKQVFELQIIQRYRYMMRLDDDSQILGHWPNIFNIMSKHQAIYLANKKEFDIEYLLPGLILVRNLTAAYITQHQISVRNPSMLTDVFNRSMEIPHYWNNFEVIDVSFMQREDVRDFIQAIDKSQGIFLYRWGDAPLRYITLALFANATDILHRETLGLIYCHPC